MDIGKYLILASNYCRAEWQLVCLNDKQPPHTRTHREKIARAGRVLEKAFRACRAAGINVNDFK